MHSSCSSHVPDALMLPPLRLASSPQHLSGQMSPEELYTFCVSPADIKDPSVAAALLRFASAYAHDGSVGGDLAMSPLNLALPLTEVRSVDHALLIPP